MKTIWTIAKREFTAYFISPIAYVYLMTYLVVVNWIFFRGFFLIGQTDLRTLFGMMPWVFLFFVPAVAMGKWAEERRQGTLEILFTLPIRDVEIVIAKFIAGLSLIALAIFSTLPLAITVSLVGNLDWGPVAGGYLGSLLMGGAYLAIGLTVSSLTESQIVAFIVSVVVCFFFLLLGTPLFAGSGSVLASLFQSFGIGAHFESISRGVIDSRDVFYYLSLTGFFLFVNLKILEVKARR